MLNQDDNPMPTVEERYVSATHASNLRVQAERSGPADVIIAMGWSPSRVGSALMRLQSEWSGSAHPKRLTTEAIKALADTYTKDADGMVQLGEDMLRTPMDAARRQAHAWHMHEVKILFGKLKTLPDVRHQLATWARLQLIENADHRVAEILHWHLDHVCPACEGRGKELIPNTPHKSHKDCKVCRGTGETRIPHLQGNEKYLHESKKMLRYINDCVKSARTALVKRLRPGKRLP